MRLSAKETKSKNNTSRILPIFLLGFFLLFSLSGENGCEKDVDFSGGSSTSDSDNPDNNFDDNDSDGLATSVENSSQVGTSSIIADTDGDGYSDGLEYVVDSGDPLSGQRIPVVTLRRRILADEEVLTNEIDGDRDGLGRSFEEDNNLDDADEDIDDDGYSDALELIANSNPFSSADIPLRTQPPIDDNTDILNGSTDSDLDGLSDAIDRAQGGDASAFDTDGDGFSDGVEFITGSNIRDAQEIPNFSVPARPDEIN